MFLLRSSEHTTLPFKRISNRAPEFPLLGAEVIPDDSPIDARKRVHVLYGNVLIESMHRLSDQSEFHDRAIFADEPRVGRAAATPWRLHDLAELRRRARLARRNGQRGRGGRPRRRARLGFRLRSRKEVRP